MALLKASRTAQYPLYAEFTFTAADTMVNTAGATVDFGKTNPGAAAGIFEIIPLPPGAVVVGGSVTTNVLFDTAGFDITIGDSGTADRYLSSTDKAGVGITALVPTGYVGTGQNIRIAFTSDDVCTAGTGSMTVRLQYIITGKANETQIA
jgi:hypothetical protein